MRRPGGWLTRASPCAQACEEPAACSDCGVDSGEECGIGADPEWPDFMEGDIIECFDLVERKQTLESASEMLKEQVKEYRSKDEERAAKAAAELEKYQKKRGAETPPAAKK